MADETRQNAVPAPAGLPPVNVRRLLEPAHGEDLREVLARIEHRLDDLQAEVRALASTNSGFLRLAESQNELAMLLAGRPHRPNPPSAP